MFDTFSKIFSKDEVRRARKASDEGMYIKAFRVNMDREKFIKFFSENNININDFTEDDMQSNYKITSKVELVTNNFNRSNIITEISLFGDKNTIDNFVKKNLKYLNGE